jgi:hypothetical protein
MLMTPAVADAQDSIAYPRSNNLKARVKATAEAVGGSDTVRVNYTVFNDWTSDQKIDLFVLTTGATPVGHIGTPGARLGWLSKYGIYQDSSTVRWFMAHDLGLIAPEDSAAPFYFSAVGLLGIVKFWARGFVPDLELPEDVAERMKAPLPIWRDSFQGWTIAVVPFPANMTALGLTQRLEALTNTACKDHLLFITESDICTNPSARQRLAEQAAQAGDVATACSHLGALIGEVDALPDTVIKPEGRALLRLNSQHFLRTHCST